MEKEAKIMI